MTKNPAKNAKQPAVPGARRQRRPLATPTDLGSEATRDIAAAMNGILADVFALYLKTKNFHWHMSGPPFRDYHVLLDEQSGQIYAMTDHRRARRKVGGLTPLDRAYRPHAADRGQRRRLRRAGHAFLASCARTPLATRLRAAHETCEEHHDIATASLIEV
jgi:starvation-inducible DNA-binding protein